VGFIKIEGMKKMSKNFIQIGDLNDFREIKNTTELKRFKEMIQIHDGLIKELHLLNSAYVDCQKIMDLNFSYSVRILLHSTADPIAVELLLGEVLELHLIAQTTEIGLDKVEMEWEPLTGFKKIILVLGENTITSRRLLYREASNWTGNFSRFGEEIILDPLTPVTELEDGRVLCTNCGEVWNAKNRIILKCPKCNGKLT
jgi:hypothetical protein